MWRLRQLPSARPSHPRFRAAPIREQGAEKIVPAASGSNPDAGATNYATPSGDGPSDCLRHEENANCAVIEVVIYRSAFKCSGANPN